MPRQRVNLVEVTVTALSIVDRHSLDALSLTAVAGELGIRPSALYTYFANIEALRHAVAVQATTNLTARLRDAAVGRAGDDAIAAMATAYRTFAADHPGQFASTLAPLPVHHGDLADAGAEQLDLFARVVAGYGHDGDEALHAARSVRSAIHGFVALEACDGLGPGDLDVSFGKLVDTVVTGLG